MMRLMMAALVTVMVMMLMDPFAVPRGRISEQKSDCVQKPEGRECPCREFFTKQSEII